jgi:hypothetical protein
MILRFSGLLLQFVEYERLIQVSAPTLEAALVIVEERHPRLRPYCAMLAARSAGPTASSSTMSTSPARHSTPPSTTPIPWSSLPG